MKPKGDNMKPKREPLLIDCVLAGDHQKFGGVPLDYYKNTVAHLRNAKRFMLDEQAAIYCAQMIADNPRIIADAQDFAIPPYDTTYIEIPMLRWFEIVSGKIPDDTADTHTGYLIHKNSVRVLAGVKGKDAKFYATREGIWGGVAHVEYRLHEPLTFQQELALAQDLGVSRTSFDFFFWGSSVLGFGELQTKPDGTHDLLQDDWDKEGLRSLRANHSFKVHLSKGLNVRELWNEIYHGSAGDLRNVIALLLFLNRTSKTRIEREVPIQANRFIGRKPANLVSHRVITFKVNPLPRLVKLGAGIGVKKRLHDRRGHFCHNEAAKFNGHDHDWIENTSHPTLQWKCECGGLRWWKNPTVAGTEKKGYVVSEYNVTK